jgi:tetratricopeptide (TPR) repeat protein
MNSQDRLQHAWSLHQSGEVIEAESIYRDVIAKDPGHAAAYVYLGIAQHDRKLFKDSVESYRAALKFQPLFPIAWNNLGNSLRMVDQLEEADFCFEQALRQNPNYLSPLKNRGTLWIWAGEIERGLEWYRRALRIVPDEPELHRNLGVIYLLQQRYAEGWHEYRYRWHFMPEVRVGGGGKIWEGEDPSGKVFLLYPEQGIGDAIQFVRAAHSLKLAGATTVVRCDPKLLPLFSSIGGIDMLIPDGLAASEMGVPDFHYQASFIEVVDRLYGRTGALATDFAAVTMCSKAYIEVSETLAGYWGRQFQLPGLKVGICWQGNPDFHADVYRSVPLKRFASIVDVPGVNFVSLQYGYGSEQLKEVSFCSQIQKLPEGIDRSAGAFLDTAAIIRNLDLVITIDTSTAHLAGALGVPVWLILGRVPDWRWREQGEVTAWYPTMRLFRQSQVGHWEELFAEIALELSSEVRNRSIVRRL